MNYYKVRPGSPINSKKVSVYGEALFGKNGLAAKNNGVIKPQDVVDEARDKKSPLHDYFDWDLKIAAQKHWLHQARLLIGSIIIDVRVKKNKIKEYKAAYSLNQTPYGTRKNKAYVVYARVFNETDLYDQVLDTAIREANYWSQKYKDYQELRLIFKAIRKTQQTINTINKRKKVS